MSKQTTISIGILLLIIGFELRSIESFTLRPGGIVANLFDPDSGGPSVAARAFSSENPKAGKPIKPPNWIGWALLSTGIVLIVYAIRCQPSG